MSAAIPGTTHNVDHVTQGLGDVSLAQGAPATGDVKSAAYTTQGTAGPIITDQSALNNGNGHAGPASAISSSHPSEPPAGSYIVTPVAGGGSHVTPLSPGASSQGAFSPNGHNGAAAGGLAGAGAGAAAAHHQQEDPAKAAAATVPSGMSEKEAKKFDKLLKVSLAHLFC